MIAHAHWQNHVHASDWLQHAPTAIAIVAATTLAVWLGAHAGRALGRKFRKK